MADPIALQIVKAVKTRLEAISIAGGFNTDPSVLRGVQVVNFDQTSDDPVISVYDDSDDPTEEQNVCQETIINLSLMIEGVQRVGNDVPGDVITYLWQDILRSILLPDSTLGGLCLSIQRGPREFIYPQEGGETVAVRQTVNILYQETYGNP